MAPLRNPWRRRVLVMMILLVLGGGVLSVALAWSRRARLVEPPVLDFSNTDPVVAHAITRWRQKVLADPRSPKAWGHLGMILLVHSFLPESNTCFRQAEQLDGKDPRWPYLQAHALRGNDPEAALVALRRAVELCGDEPDAPRLLLGEMLFQDGRLDEAEQHFQSVLKRDPANGRAHLVLGRIESERDALDAAVPHYRQAAADGRTRKMGLIQLAEAYQRRGDADAAAAAQNQANELPPDPAWPDPFFQQCAALLTGESAAINHAVVLLGSDRVAEALQWLLETIRDYPNSSQAWLLLGRALLRKGDVPAAESALRQSLQLKEEVPEAQFYLGIALLLQNKPKEALPYFRKATELQPNYPSAHYKMGECLRQLHDLPGAIEAFEKALHCQPAFADAHLRLGQVLYEQGQTTQASEHLRQALRLLPQNEHARQLLKRLHWTDDAAAPAKPSSPNKSR